MKSASPRIPDIQLIEDIKAGGNRRDTALNVFLEDITLKRWIIGVATSRGGAVEDGEELFLSAVRIFAQRIVEEKFRGESSLRTYLAGIAQLEWQNMYRKKERRERVEAGGDHSETIERTPSHLFDSNKEVLQNMVQGIVQNAPIGQRCKEIMVLWFQAYKNHEIEEKTGSTDAARDRYKCYQQFVAYVKSQPHIIEQLKAF